MPGPRPQPTALKLLAGNPGKRRIATNEPTPTVMVPTCPRVLTGESRREWKRITTELAILGLVSQVDRATLVCYCLAWGRLVQAEQHLNENGPVTVSSKGIPMHSPWGQVANSAMQMLLKCGAEFGFSPASRVRLATPTQVSNSNNRWDGLLASSSDAASQEIRSNPADVQPENGQGGAL